MQRVLHVSRGFGLKISIFALLCTGMPLVGSALSVIQSEICPCAITVSAPGNRYYFRMEKDGRAAVYQRGERDTVFYEFSDAGHWVPEGVLLSEDGTKVAQRGPYGNPSSVPPTEALGIAFYDRGNLIAKYSVMDLMADPKCIMHRVTGQYAFYHWGFVLKWLNNDDSSGEVELDTLDNQALAFDIHSGQLLERKRFADGCFTPRVPQTPSPLE